MARDAEYPGPRPRPLDDAAFDGEAALSREVKDDMKANPEVRRLLREEFEALVAARDRMRRIQPAQRYLVNYQLPCNVRRTIQNVQHKFRIDRHASTSLSPRDVVLRVRELLAAVEQTVPSLDSEARGNAVFYFSCLLRACLASKCVTLEHRLTREAFEYLVDQLQRDFERAIVSPGESVGPIAAQSMSDAAG